MKRYDRWGREDEKGVWRKYSEVEAEHLKLSTERLQAIDAMQKMELELKTELAKKDKLYNELYVITNEEMDKLAAKIARLRKAVREIEYLADRITVENESIAKAIIKLAREALAEKE